MVTNAVSARLDVACQGGFLFRGFVVLITRFGFQPVEMSRLPVHLRPRSAIPSALADLTRLVGALTLSAFIGVVSHYLTLFWFVTWENGISRDATGTHIQFNFLFGEGPLMDVCAS